MALSSTHIWCSTLTTSSCAAYQVFLCHLRGFGTINITSAGKHLFASARSAYTNAFCTSAWFHQRYPNVQPSGVAADIEALSQAVSSGPWPGFLNYAQYMQLLREIARNNCLNSKDRTDGWHLRSALSGDSFSPRLPGTLALQC
jgi:hypothetical protein